MKIISVVGARPNFMKIAPFIRAIERYNMAAGRYQADSVAGQRETGSDRKDSGSGTPVEHILVHTGQHYDHQMSQAFFDDLGIPSADVHLGVGSGSHAPSTGGTSRCRRQVISAGIQGDARIMVWPGV